MAGQKFGIYIHTPYCIQRCTYCDFATYEQRSILPPEDYFKLVLKEINLRAQISPLKDLTSVYFGGGTPSLVDPKLLALCLEALIKNGFIVTKDTEITIEVNPATLTSEKIQTYKNLGINRYSVGAQTFNDRLLKSVHREHSAQDTRQTLSLLEKFDVPYSFDILFALPHQDLNDLASDLSELNQFCPVHVSPYCLTVPENHLLSQNRPSEDHQVKMFSMIQSALEEKNFLLYEISNFAKLGFESKHNMLYWTDQSYWGIGLSAHSYSVSSGSFGTRFWNPKGITEYQRMVNSWNNDQPHSDWTSGLGVTGFEELKIHEALTDFCHVSLRLARGLDLREVQSKFKNPKIHQMLLGLLEPLVETQVVTKSSKEPLYFLTEKGRLLSNQVFSSFTFLADDFESLT